MNKLTEKLLAEGYTKNNHPDYVEWSGYQDFEYTHEYLIGTVWETPCGLLKKGIDSYNHDSHMGVDYCPENDNPRYGCPYYDEKPCSHRFITNGLWGWNCAYHQTDKPYDYEQSVEKLWDEWDKIKHTAWMEATQGCYCGCLEWDRSKRKYVKRFYVARCIQIGCKNEVCVITKLTRNLDKVNIFYEILRVKHYQIGLIENTERTLEKGVKVFNKSVARTDAEIWLKHNQNKFSPRMNRYDRTNVFFSEHHGETGFGEYEWFKFSITPQNIRIERWESRDLLQDLRDIQEGFEVTHASDLQKQKKEAYKERKVKRQEAKQRRIEKRSIETWNQWLKGDNDNLKRHAERELKKRGTMPEVEYEQGQLF